MGESFFKKIIKKIEKKGLPTESDEAIKPKKEILLNEEIDEGAEEAVERLRKRIQRDSGGERDKTQL